jgi:hypothetical protein
MTARRSSVYLSGWEYNRLLQKEPTQSRISALPAAILWNGSHQLWMFENIYCSKESFDNEVQATERLGWVNGRVLRELYDKGIFQTVDWAGLPTETKHALRKARSNALSALSEQGVRDAIVAGDASALELAKMILLQPILDHYSCFESGVPNSVGNWFKPASAGQQSGTRIQDTARQQFAQEKLSYLGSIAAPGLDLCRPPGTGVSQEARDRQRHVQNTIEKPMIPELLAGEGKFSGPGGFLPYLRDLEKVKDAYRETNEQLTADWEANRNSLFRLRDAASKYLWPDLHDYWLPRLLSQDLAESKVSAEFEQWITNALRLRPIARYLHARPTVLIMGTFGPPALAAALAHAKVPFPDAVVTSGLAGLAAVTTRKHLDQVARLAIFFQEARKPTST